MNYAVIHADADRRLPMVVSQHRTFKAAERERRSWKKSGFIPSFVIFREAGFGKWEGCYLTDLDCGDRLFHNSDSKYSPGETLVEYNVSIKLGKHDLGLHFVPGESIDGKFDEVKYA